MDTNLDVALRSQIQANNYMSLAMLTVVAYDYFLNFSREVDNVWHRPWTKVSTMYLLVRYMGLAFIIPQLIYFGRARNVCTILYFRGGLINSASCFVTFLVTLFEYFVFLSAADLVMILRVYAMWSRSNIILYVLLFIYGVNAVVTMVVGTIYYRLETSYIVTKVVDLSFCTVEFRGVASPYNQYIQIPRLVLGSTLLVLAITRTLRETADMYQQTRQWQLNSYLRLLVREGAIYFFVTISICSITFLEDNGVITNDVANILYMLNLTVMCTMMPGFIIGVRELYDVDSRGRLRGLDTGFGGTSQFVSSRHTVLSAIAFADVELEENQLEEQFGEAIAAMDPGKFLDKDTREMEGVQIVARSGGV